jgi:hypothetical protein
MTSLAHPFFATLLLAWATAQAQAPAKAQATTTVNRCEAQGRVVFQQAPCPPGQQASQVAIPSPQTNVAAPPPRAAAAASPAASAPQPAAPQAPQALLPPGPPPEQEACLTYLKPLLHDPASGRIVSSTRDGRVLQVKLQASDKRGKPQIRDAACEFINGRVDDSWSRIQLKRLGWFAPRVLVQGDSREARRAARVLEESIEAAPL